MQSAGPFKSIWHLLEVLQDFYGYIDRIVLNTTKNHDTKLRLKLKYLKAICDSCMNQETTLVLKSE